MTKIEWGIGIALTILIILLGMATHAENEQWEQFAEEHHCVLVKSTKPTTTVGVAAGEPLVVVNPGSKTYECDNGVKYTR
jgi:hypothetical protein